MICIYVRRTATCATYSINWLDFITETKSVYSAVRTGSLNKAFCTSSLKGYYRDFIVWVFCVEAFRFNILNMQNWKSHYHAVDTQLFSLHPAASVAMDLCILRQRTNFKLRTQCWSSHNLGTTVQAHTHCLCMSFSNPQKLEFMDYLNQKVEEKNVRELSYCSRGGQNNVIHTIRRGQTFGLLERRETIEFYDRINLDK